MTRSAVFLVVAAASLAAGEDEAYQFRLAKDPAATVSAWITGHDQDGFRFESLARDRKATVKWTDLVEEDARRLRIGFGLDLTEDEEKGLIEGHELRLKGGLSVRGLLHRIDDEGSYWMRVQGNLLPYPKDRVKRVDAVRIGEDEAYGPEEVYARRLSRRPPRTAEEHRRLADYLYDVGNFDAARQHYDDAVAMDPSIERQIEKKLGNAREYLEDRAAAEVFAKHKADAFLNGRWREAIDAIRAYAEANPAMIRRGEKLIAEMEELWLAAKEARYHAVKHEEFDRAIRSKLARAKPTMEEATSWLKAEIAGLVAERTARRLGFSDDEMALFAGTKSKGALHWASYWSGTFAISKRAAVGQSTAREVKGDPEGWWTQYDDVNVRASWLKAYAAETLDLFEVERTTQTACERCGGTGQIRKWSAQGLKALGAGGNDWKERCPRCFGACIDRGVGYR
jgi:tetratricopeptide (TPR) repeat protein